MGGGIGRRNAVMKYGENPGVNTESVGIMIPRQDQESFGCRLNN